MIRITFLFLLLSGITLTAPQVRENENSDANEQYNKAYWTYLIEKLTMMDNHRGPTKFQDSVNIYLRNADSGVVAITQEVIGELQPLMQQPISLTDTPEKANFKLTIADPDSGVITHKQAQHRHNQETKYSAIILTQMEITLRIPDTLTPLERKNLLRFHIVSNLCEANGSSKTTYRNSIFSFKENTEGEQLLSAQAKTSFTPVDKFIIKELYNLNFYENLKQEYIRRYSWVGFMSRFQPHDLQLFRWAATFFFIIIYLLPGQAVFTGKKRKYPLLNYLVPAIWTVVVYTITAATLKYLSFEPSSYVKPFNPPGFPYYNLVTSIVVVTPIVTLVVTALYYIESRFINKDSSREIVLWNKFLYSGLCTIAVLLAFLAIYNYIPPMLTFILIAAVITRTIFLYFQMRVSTTMNKKELEIVRLRERNSRAELDAINARFNPHFLYNSLNSIASLAFEQPDRTAQMAVSLASYFRKNINRENEVNISLEEEFESLQNYLEIEQVRFEDRLAFTISLDPELNNIRIPRNIVQPLVENSVKHGVSQNTGKTDINITAIAFENGLEIRVTDTGPAFPEGVVSGYGLQSIQEILRLTYGEKAWMEWHNSPEKHISIYISDLIPANQ